MKVLPLILAVLLLVTACGGEVNPQDREDVYKIGVFQPLTGEDAKAAEAEINGIKLAHKLNPTILGKKVELVFADNKSDTFNGNLAARKLVNHGVNVVLGSYGNVMSMMGGKYFEEAKIPAIALTCNNPLVTTGNPYYLRMGVVDSFQAPIAANFILSRFELESIAIIRITNDDYGMALAQSFTDAISEAISESTGEEIEGEIEIENIEIKKEAEELELLETKLRELMGKNKEAVYLPCSSKDSAEIIKKAHEIGYKPQFVGTNLWHDEDFLEDGGEALEGIVFTDYIDGSSSVNDKTSDFQAAYKEAYGVETIPAGAALGYDGYMLAIKALEEQASNNSWINLIQILLSTKDFEGVTGKISFNEDGDPIKPMLIFTVENGEFKEKLIAAPDAEELEDLTENGEDEENEENESEAV